MAPLFVLTGGPGVDLCDGDAASVGRWIEGEGILAVGGRQVPSEDLAVLRLCVVSEGSDDELAWQRELPELDPYLPIDTFLTEGILLAGHIVGSAGADVICSFDFLYVGIVSTPFEEVVQGHFDAVLIVEIVGQLGEGWWRGNRGVIVDNLSEDGEVLSVEEKESMSVVVGDLDSHAVGSCGYDIDLGAELDGLPIVQNIIGCNVRPDLKGLQGAKIGSHLVECFHCAR